MAGIETPSSELSSGLIRTTHLEEQKKREEFIDLFNEKFLRKDELVSVMKWLQDWTYDTILLKDWNSGRKSLSLSSEIRVKLIDSFDWLFLAMLKNWYSIENKDDYYFLKGFAERKWIKIQTVYDNNKEIIPMSKWDRKVYYTFSSNWELLISNILWWLPDQIVLEKSTINKWVEIWWAVAFIGWLFVPVVGWAITIAWWWAIWFGLAKDTQNDGKWTAEWEKIWWELKVLHQEILSKKDK